MYNNGSAHVTIYEQAYIFPHGVLALSTTSTKFGIATKDIVGEFLALSLAHSLFSLIHAFFKLRVNVSLTDKHPSSS